MIERVIEYSINNKFIVLVVTGFLILSGVTAMNRIPLDAIPDLSDVQVIIYTEYPGQAPQVVEDQVTYPLTTALLSVPGSKAVRGMSFFGFSMIYVIFDDGTDMYWARSRVLEYLNFAAGRMPQGVRPRLGPDATGVGWVFEYTLESTTHDLAELRTIQDWYVRYQLTSVKGVSEVASIGGFVKQYQIILKPNELLTYKIPLARIREAVVKSNRDVGGRLVEISETEFMVRSLGYVKTTRDLEQIPLGVDKNGTPILLKQVADVRLGPELRRGLLEKDGRGEVVGGIVVMRFGENALAVINAVKKRLKLIRAGLPDGVEIKVAYDRSELILSAVETLRDKLFEEMLVVAIICVIFLLHVRSALVAIITLPVGILCSLTIMQLLGINANIMSLGGIAIAIGVMVDASVVMVENAHKHLERDAGKKPQHLIMLDAAKEVGPALFYSLLIITVSFLPVFSLSEQSGRLFKPLAFTKTFAMGASSVLAVTLIPVLMVFFVRGRILPERKNPISRFFIWVYRPFIEWVLAYRKTTLIIALGILAFTFFPARKLGSEFMPPLDEGDLLYMPTTLPGLSVTKAKEILQQTDKLIRRIPEVKLVLGKIGRAGTATDPAPMTMIETTVMLKPRSAWRKGMTMDKLQDELIAAINLPGLTDAWTMPIKTRIDMLSTGIKTPIGIKVLGGDLSKIDKLARQIETVIKNVDGTRSVVSDRVLGGRYLQIEPRSDLASRYGLTVGMIQDVIMTAVGGMNVSYSVEGLKRFPINIRYSRELRDNEEELKRILIPTPTREIVTLGQVADFRFVTGPAAIKTEGGMKTAWLYVDIRGDVDIGTYIDRANDAIERGKASGAIDAALLKQGYAIRFSGQFEYMEAARKRLVVVIPVTIVLIFLLLYFHFSRLADTLIVMLSLPFALVGGVWLLYILGYDLSVAVHVGFIALAGLAAETGVVMLVYLNEAFERFVREGRMRTRADLHRAIEEGAVERVRPKLMTVATTLIGLLPVMFGAGTGSQVMRRIAAPMVGGLITSTILTLVIIPAIYAMVRWPEVKRLTTEAEHRTALESAATTATAPQE
ncbi:MAG: efflux RND transporter permease subunit [Myxococcales bacterium]|nr:efflux RND transporter permease subunit [Myxococcales bacterium]